MLDETSEIILTGVMRWILGGGVRPAINGLAGLALSVVGMPTTEMDASGLGTRVLS